MQSYEQLVTDINEAFGPKHRHAKIRKLYSVRGKEVHGISDFFRDDDCFIAVNVGEAHPTDGDVGDLLEELYPEGNYAKVFLREWEKNQRRSRRSVAGSLKSNRDAVNTNAAAKYQNNNNDSATNNANLQAGSHVPDKRDSGFDSSDASTNRSEPDGGATDRRGAQHRPRRKMWRGAEPDNAPSEAGTASPQQQPQQPGYYLLKKMEKERMKQANEERERAKRRAQKMVEAERRAAEEEKRKKGQVPVRNMDNPFKRTDDPRDKEREEAARRKREEEKRRREEERAEQEKKEKEREEREQAERAARERMLLAEKKEKEAQEKERGEQEERDRKRKEKEERAQRKAEKTSKAKDGASPAAPAAGGQNETSPAQKQDAAQTKDNQGEADTTAAAAATTAADAAAADETDGGEAASTAAPAAAQAATAAKDQAAIQRQQQKEKRRQEREEKQQRKRAKTKIVRKTKEERQVGSDDYILERYDLGRKLGDGNFAVVRQSRKKETGQEFAVKVIDKAKLKGKEHMVENEIDIMKDCNHSNIVRLFEEYETAERIYLVMELVKVRGSWVMVRRVWVNARMI